MENIDTRATAFGRVLDALVEERGIPAEPEEIRALAERSGLDGDRFLARAANPGAPNFGPLSGLDREMGLSEPEMSALAYAYAYEKDLPCALPGCERPALPRDEFGDCAGHRAAYDARADVEAWELAQMILEPWLETTKPIGSDELTLAMEVALAHVEDRITMARERLESAEAALGG
ncbi:MAG: hypothetical protein M3N18_05920 [Actinomycetota bacterium]|nr:hypothetical protein [Actinomycetota bacterium]